MKERPIIFSGPMVRAILEDRKFQTRRVMNPQPFDVELFEIVNNGTVKYRRPAGDPMLDEARSTPGYSVRSVIEGLIERCPYGKLGDRLWVRETFDCFGADFSDAQCGITYRADNHSQYVRCLEWPQKVSLTPVWRPSIHMPRWASRITLEIEQVRVQRVQEITEEDAIAEGSQISVSELPKTCQQATWTERQQLSRIWDSINSKRGFGWEVNPWVWCLTFKRVSA